MTTHGGPVRASTRTRYPFPRHVIVGSLMDRFFHHFVSEVLVSKVESNRETRKTKTTVHRPPCVLPIGQTMDLDVDKDIRISNVFPFLLIVELHRWRKVDHEEAWRPTRNNFLYRKSNSNLVFCTSGERSGENWIAGKDNTLYRVRWLVTVLTFGYLRYFVAF